jgi:hypothetical protein
MTIIDWTGRYGGYKWVVTVRDGEDYIALEAVPVDRESKADPPPPWTSNETLNLRPEHIPALATAIRLLRQLAAKEASAKRQEPEAIGA